MAIPQKYMGKDLLPAYFAHELNGYYDENEARTIGRWVMSDITGKSLIEMSKAGPSKWSAGESERISEILNRLRHGEPIQYILGHTEFFGLNFHTGKGILIPRNETEELVEWVLSDSENQLHGCRILDIGCGSGAIAVSLARNLPEATLYAVDVSSAALEHTVVNSENHRVELVCGFMDILNPSGYFAENTYDIIVSNPPYVLESQKPFLERRVREMEPPLALFVPDYDPMVFFRAISNFASRSLNSNGRVYVEINEQLAEETLKEFERDFLKTELRKDIHGKYRLIKATNGKDQST